MKATYFFRLYIGILLTFLGFTGTAQISTVAAKINKSYSLTLTVDTQKLLDGASVTDPNVVTLSDGTGSANGGGLEGFTTYIDRLSNSDLSWIGASINGKDLVNITRVERKNLFLGISFATKLLLQNKRYTDATVIDATSKQKRRGKQKYLIEFTITRGGETSGPFEVDPKLRIKGGAKLRSTSNDG